MSQLLTGIALTIEYIAVFVLVAGFCTIIFINIPKGYSAYKNNSSNDLYTVIREMRLHLGQTLLLGLEILIVSEVIFSVSHRTLEEVSILGLTVLVRVGLSFFLNLELDHINSAKKYES